jgi:hypothetical protein
VLRQVQKYPDGRYDIVSVGTQRFRLLDLDESQPYLQGEVEFLPDPAGAAGEAQLAAAAVRPAFSAYLRALASLAQHDPQPPPAGAAPQQPGPGNGGADAGAVPAPDLPAEPVALSYVIAALMVVDLPDKQALLAEPDAAGRLAAERAMLAKETAMLRGLTSAPAPGLRYSPYSNN